MLLYINCLMALGVHFIKVPNPSITQPSNLYTYKRK